MDRHRTGTVRALQGERTRERIVEAACELFVHDGSAGTSLDAIVERAGVTNGALHHQLADTPALPIGAYDVVIATALVNAAINEALHVATAPDVSAEFARAVPALRALLAGCGAAN